MKGSIVFCVYKSHKISYEVVNSNTNVAQKISQRKIMAMSIAFHKVGKKSIPSEMTNKSFPTFFCKGTVNFSTFMEKVAFNYFLKYFKIPSIDNASTDITEKRRH